MYNIINYLPKIPIGRRTVVMIIVHSYNIDHRDRVLPSVELLIERARHPTAAVELRFGGKTKSEIHAQKDKMHKSKNNLPDRARCRPGRPNSVPSRRS